MSSPSKPIAIPRMNASDTIFPGRVNWQPSPVSVGTTIRSASEPHSAIVALAGFVSLVRSGWLSGFHCLR
jgi:hypothetical protein